MTDPRLLVAIGAIRRWYEMTFTLNGLRWQVVDGVWVAVDDPPPFHSFAISLRPGLDAGAAARAVERTRGGGRGSYADPYAELDLEPYGYELFFEATWVHRPAARPVDPAPPPGWTVVGAVADLEEWSVRHDYVGVLPPAVFARRDVDVLARVRDGELTAGAVMHEGSDAVSLTNVWARPGESLDWAELVAVAAVLHPNRDLVGYERGADLDAALGAGFVGLGTHRVWARIAR